MQLVCPYPLVGLTHHLNLGLRSPIDIYATMPDDTDILWVNDRYSSLTTEY